MACTNETELKRRLDKLLALIYSICVNSGVREIADLIYEGKDIETYEAKSSSEEVHKDS